MVFSEFKFAESNVVLRTTQEKFSLEAGSPRIGGKSINVLFLLVLALSFSWISWIIIESFLFPAPSPDMTPTQYRLQILPLVLIFPIFTLVPYGWISLLLFKKEKLTLDARGLSYTLSVFFPLFRRTIPLWKIEKAKVHKNEHGIRIQIHYSKQILSCVHISLFGTLRLNVLGYNLVQRIIIDIHEENLMRIVEQFNHYFSYLLHEYKPSNSDDLLPISHRWFLESDDRNRKFSIIFRGKIPIFYLLIFVPSFIALSGFVVLIFMSMFFNMFVDSDVPANSASFPLVGIFAIILSGLLLCVSIPLFVWNLRTFCRCCITITPKNVSCRKTILGIGFVRSWNRSEVRVKKTPNPSLKKFSFVFYPEVWLEELYSLKFISKKGEEYSFNGLLEEEASWIKDVLNSKTKRK